MNPIRCLARLARLAVTLLLSAVLARADSPVGESASFAFDTRDNTAQLAAESAVFAFDTRLIDGLVGTTASSTFILDTRANTALGL